MDCPACQTALELRRVAAVDLHACAACRGMFVPRQAVATLGTLEPSAFGGPFRRPGQRTSPEATGAVAFRACPRCGKRMHGHAYGGGNVRVETCDDCDRVFLDAGELEAIQAERRDGIAMAEEAKRALHATRVAGTWRQLHAADAGSAAAALLAIYLFVRLSGEGSRPGRWLSSTLAVTLAALAALAFYVVHRRRSLREKREAEGRLERLVDAEEWRTRTPASPALVSSSSRTAPLARRKTCSFCQASMAPDTTHCTVCDSDFPA